MDYKKIKETENKNKSAFLQVNPRLNEGSGIYFLIRTNEQGIKYFYVGQSLHILTRLAQHMAGFQHIDTSLKKYGLYSEENPHGWRVEFINYPTELLDEMEKHYILQYTKAGYQCRYNKTSGSQGVGKEKINEYKPSRTYRDGLKQGKIMLARELSHIAEKHLEIDLKADKRYNKISQKALQKFNDLLDENTHK